MQQTKYMLQNFYGVITVLRDPRKMPMPRKPINYKLQNMDSQHFHKNYITFPIRGRSTAPQVSAAQCTTPEAKSAVKTPAIAANNREASARMCLAMRMPALMHKVQQITTHTNSCSLLPVKQNLLHISHALAVLK